MGTVLFVIAQRIFRDEEYAHPRDVLETRGFEVVTASEEAGPAVGRFGLEVEADIALEDAVASGYDAVVFIGGAGAATFFDDPLAHNIARTLHEDGRVVAAICIAPSTLAHAGLLDGIRVTSFPSQREDLEIHGAIWTGADVEIDGSIITASGPDAARAFGEAIADSLDAQPTEQGGRT